ncbi:MAG: hypothetical protein CMO80_12475 [Verrucomicrobiales bacterium]|nr:hypothetical protein [Verrucomicrobiales bacterium]|tara:strand:+ start:67 stop:399 length:333 start_codon:yes stop_codon:yes gene_type:complete
MSVLMTGILLFMKEPPDSVHSKGETVLILIPIMLVIAPLVICMIAFLSWKAEQGALNDPQVVINEYGLEFRSKDSHSRQPVEYLRVLSGNTLELLYLELAQSGLGDVFRT